MPEWYKLVRAAHYYGIAPWELAEMPTVWTEWAICAEDAERRAETELTQERIAANKANKK